ncbi:MAG: hypothetical protein AAGJ35_08445, partial [Myxococcota bacterium]
MPIKVFLSIAFCVLLCCCQLSEEEQKQQEQSRCDLQGTCVIDYTYNDKGDAELKRACDLQRDKDRACGDCWDIQRQTDNRIRQKTCLVCNLCVKEMDCIDDEGCKVPTPWCVEGRCVECRVAQTQDCKDNTRPFCVDRSCRQCRTNLDCPIATPRCQDSVCLACGCASGTQCDRQANGNIRCVQCKQDKDCPSATPRCNVAEGRCRADCGEDQECPTGLRCVQG